VRRRDWKLRVEDILRASQRVSTFLQGVSWEQFGADEKVVAAVSYELIIIGEAVKGIPESVQAGAGAVPWEQMRGMRNVVAHEYFGVDLRVVWDTATRDVPAIVKPLRALLAAS